MVKKIDKKIDEEPEDIVVEKYPLCSVSYEKTIRP